MPTTALDHVNILTDDLDATIAFYEKALELTRGRSVVEDRGLSGAWMIDAGGNALLHLVGRDPHPGYGDDYVSGVPTGAIHHFAFRCSGFAEAQARLEAAGIPYRTNDGMHGLRQIVVVDPNGVNVEMNFPAL